MAKHYGGVSNDSPDKGKAAYSALSGDTSGFNAVLGGNRSVAGQYERLEAHGFYWTVRLPAPCSTRGMALTRTKPLAAMASLGLLSRGSQVRILPGANLS